MTYSYNEMAVLGKNAAKAVGLSWGLAAEAGHAFATMASIDAAFADDFLHLLALHETKSYDDLSFVQEEHNITPKQEIISPFILGSYICDFGVKFCNQNAIIMHDIAYPAFIMPFLMKLLQDDDNHIISLSDSLTKPLFCNMISKQKIECAGEMTGLKKGATLTLSMHEMKRDDASPIHPRIDISPQIYEALQAYAKQIYAPATELSRLRGAGGE